MPRPPFIKSSEFPYHVTARTNNKEPFHAPMEKVWKIAFRTLCANSIKHQAVIEAFVLMPNHFHLIVSTPEANLDLLMRDWLREFTFKVNAAAGRSGRLFGARYFRCLISDSEYLDNVFRYVYRNPVKAGLTQNAEIYKFSTILSDLIQASKGGDFFCKLEFKEMDVENKSYLNWINEKVATKEDDLIREALRRRIFASRKDRDSRLDLIKEIVQKRI